MSVVSTFTARIERHPSGSGRIIVTRNHDQMTVATGQFGSDEIAVEILYQLGFRPAGGRTLRSTAVVTTASVEIVS